MLPSDCATSIGTGDAAKTVVLLDCSNWDRGETAADFPTCDWFTHPAGARQRRGAARAGALRA